MRKPIPFGKYLLLERVNVGGMAEVFLAKAFGVEGFERMLAIKRILPTMVEDEEFVTMFLDEARISVQLNHANVVHVTDLGKHEDSYYIAMEYVSGKDVRHLLEHYRKRHEAMPVPQAVFITSKICEGLDYAHRRKDARGQDLNIIHRDVSPQNVLLSFEGEVKIIDFGIAKAANRAQKTQAGILKGKFGYMSPEQVRGMPIDHRSDIFAVGVILYEMLTGERLFVGESDFSTLEKVRNAEVLPPREYNSNIPAGLERIVLKALAREPEERYQWCSDMQEDLLRYLLAGDSIFTSKHLGTFMKQTFVEDLEREKLRLEHFAEVERPPQVEFSGVTAAPRPAPVRPPTPAPAPRMPTPLPQPAIPDPFNPVIPPPESDELAEMGGGERTEIFRAPAEPHDDSRARSAALEDEESEDGSEAATILGMEAPVYKTPSRKPAAAGAGPSSKVEVNEPGSESDASTVLGMEAPSYDEPRRQVRPKLDFAAQGETIQGMQAPQYPASRRAAATLGSDEPTPPPDEPLSEPQQPEQSEQAEQPEESQQNAETVLGLQAPSYAPRRPAPRPAPRRPTRPVQEAAEPEDEEPAARPRRPTPRPVRGGGLLGEENESPDLTPVGPSPAASAGKRSKLPIVIAAVGVTALLAIGAAALFRTAAPGKLVILAKPPIADITVDGRPASSGETLELPAGEHEVVASARGHQQARERVQIKSGEALPLEIILKRLPREETEPGGAPPNEPAPKQVEPEAGDEPAQAQEDVKAQEEPKAPEGPKAAEQPKAQPHENPAPEPVKQAAAELKPKLEIESEPAGAMVEIAGNRVGRTPLTVAKFDADKVKEIKVTAKGYKPLMQPVYWDGETKEISVFAQLEKEPAAAAPAPKPEPAKPQPKAAKAPKGFGKLVTMSNPVAKIAIDGKDTGRWTPVVPKDPLKIPAGDHTITYTAADGRKATRKVSVAVDETVKMVGVSDFN